MGGTQSKPSNFIDVSSFDVGDVVLFTEKGGKSAYNVRYCKWISYSFAAFVVKNESGDVQLCGHFPSATAVGGQHPVVLRSLDEFNTGMYDAVYARKLVHQPTPEASKRIDRFASHVVAEFATLAADHQRTQRAEAMSKYCTHSDEEVVIMMGAADRKQWLSCTSNPVEHFTTSRLVAEMLLEADLVTGNGHIFSATTRDEKVLAPVQEVELKTPPKGFSSRLNIQSLMRVSKQQ